MHSRILARRRLESMKMHRRRSSCVACACVARDTFANASSVRVVELDAGKSRCGFGGITASTMRRSSSGGRVDDDIMECILVSACKSISLFMLVWAGRVDKAAASLDAKRESTFCFQAERLGGRCYEIEKSQCLWFFARDRFV